MQVPAAACRFCLLLLQFLMDKHKLLRLSTTPIRYSTALQQGLLSE